MDGTDEISDDSVVSHFGSTVRSVSSGARTVHIVTCTFSDSHCTHILDIAGTDTAFWKAFLGLFHFEERNRVRKLLKYSEDIQRATSVFRAINEGFEVSRLRVVGC